MASRRTWGLVVGYIVLLFAVQPRLGFAIDAFKQRWGAHALDVTAYTIAAVAAALVALLCVPLWRTARRSDRAALVAAALLYAAGVTTLQIPQERLHYLEYGVLAGLLYGAFSNWAAAPGAWRPAMAALLVAGALGFVDEKLQGWLWERRYFDWADVRLNLRAALLGVLVAVPALRAWRRRPRP